MATLYFLGLAPAVAQVSTVQVLTYAVGTTYKVTIGGVTISTIAAGSVNATATALQSALSTSTHPYFTAITWTVATDTVTGTAKQAGCPFVATSSASGSTGTIGAVATPTVSSGPNDWSTASNWNNGTTTPTVPASGDTVIFSNNSVNVCWGLSTAVTGVTTIRLEQSYTGRIGLDYSRFATTADGASYDTSVAEYRQLYAAIGVSSLQIGTTSISGSASGSGRLMFDLGTTTACTVDVYGTASTSSDTNRSCVRLLANNGSTNVYIRSAPGGVAICAEVPNETSTIGALIMYDTSASSKLITGASITMASFLTYGGACYVRTNNTIASVKSYGGTTTLEGSANITTIIIYGGTVYNNFTGTTALVSMNGGVISSFGSAVSRTWTQIALNTTDCTVQLDPSVITWTTFALAKRLTISS